MKHISRVVALIFMAILLADTSFVNYGVSYSYSHEDGQLTNQMEHISMYSGWASDLCVSNEDVLLSTGDLETAPYGAGLFDLNNKQVVYGKNIHQIVEPASITKLMTALVTFKYGNLSDKVVVSKNALITEPGAKLCGFYPGDDLNLEQALYGLLVYSGNDAGVVIAEHISGGVAEFSKLMNAEAKALGATNTNFVNPHGLTADNHYTTIYDLYLIFNELLNYPKFLEIIQTKSYTYYPNNPTIVYKDVQVETAPTTEVPVNQTDSIGPSSPTASQKITIKQPVDRSKLIWDNTNWYFTGEAAVPENVKVVGGKTGTTYAAGNCLILLSEDMEGNSFISIVMKAKSRPELYLQMSDLLKEIAK